MNVDVFGLAREDLIQEIDDEDIEFFKLEKLQEGDIQDLLILLLPEKKKGKIRKKGYLPEEVEIIQNYIENGGTAIIIAPMDEKHVNKMLELYEKFDFTPIINDAEKLLHGNLNLGFFIRRKDGKYGNVKKHVKRYAHFVTAVEDVEILFEGNYLPAVLRRWIGEGQILLYGLEEEEFWRNDFGVLVKYLINDYEGLWEQVDDELEFFEAFEKNNKVTTEQRQQIYRAMARQVLKKKSLDSILDFTNQNFRDIVLGELDFEKIVQEMAEVHEKNLVRQYRLLHERAREIKNDRVRELLEQYMIKQIEEGHITQDDYELLLKRNLLPKEGDILYFFFFQPHSMKDYEKFKQLAKRLQEWNKEMNLFDEQNIKRILKEHLRVQRERIQAHEEEQRRLKELEEKRLKEKQEEELRKKQKEDEERRRREELNRQRLERLKKEREAEIERQRQLREQRKKEYEEQLKKRIEEKKRREQQKEEIRRKKEQEELERQKIKEEIRRRSIEEMKRKKAYDLRMQQIKEQKMLMDKLKQKEELEYKKIQEDYRKRRQEMQERVERARKEKEYYKKLKEEKISQRIEELTAPKLLAPALEKTPEEKLELEQKFQDKIINSTIEIIEFLFRPEEFITLAKELEAELELDEFELEEVNKTTQEAMEFLNSLQPFFDFTDFLFNPLVVISEDDLEELEELDDLV
ncbi:MAG: hypothetical protein ACTSRW_11810 [Candidatus Helarchaeota archaeon]